MIKVAFLYERLEWTEEEIERILAQRNDIILEKFSIKEECLEKILSFKPDFILNRIYASICNRDFKALNKTMSLLQALEKNNILVINSYSSNQSEYSKLHSFFRMQENNIKTAKTICYNQPQDLQQIVKELRDFPIIVKRDSGGRGLDVSKCYNIEELEQSIEIIKSSKDYQGKIILQEFIQPTEDRDYRVWVVDGKVVFFHGRSLKAIKPKEKPWLASISLGSKLLPLTTKIPKELEELSINAAKAVGATFDVLDIVKSKDGYVVIEHNLTPQFTPEYIDIFKFNPIHFFMDKILNKFNIKL